MKVLGIETSCDETAAAVVENGITILSNVVASSSDIHNKTGGVIPEIAAREQIKYIIPVIDKATAGNGISFTDIDCIAITVGPGLIGSLLVGVETAKTLAVLLNKPIVPINHVRAHIYANWLNQPALPEFPAIALVVSGGHTELFLMQSHEEIIWVGGTLDDAAGEAFDKTARLLELGGYPGGPAIASYADKKHGTSLFRFPRPMIASKDLNFSFSGLKAAVLREVVKLKKENQFGENEIIHLAHETQEAITDVLTKKTLSAAEKFNVKSILLGGGVAANKRLKQKLQDALNQSSLHAVLYVPPTQFCTDNASYIASYGYFHNSPIDFTAVQAKPDLEVEV